MSEISKKIARRRIRYLRMWFFGSIACVVLIFVSYAKYHDRFCGCKSGENFAHMLGFRRGSVDVKHINTDLGVERPDLLPITEIKIKRDEKQRRDKFKKEHDGNEECVYYCHKHCKGHDECIYCDEKKKSYYSKHRRRR